MRWSHDYSVDQIDLANKQHCDLNNSSFLKLDTRCATQFALTEINQSTVINYRDVVVLGKTTFKLKTKIKSVDVI